jgi:hypothetical protein
MPQPPHETTRPKGGAWLEIVVHGSPATTQGGYSNIAINGWMMRGGFGRQTIPVREGMNRVEAWLPGDHGSRAAYAAMDVLVAEGQTVSVFYAPPHSVFSSGRIGLTPQKRRGLGCLISFVVIIALLLVAPIVGLAIYLSHVVSLTSG